MNLLESIRQPFGFHKFQYSSTAIEIALKFIYYNGLLAAPPTPALMTELLELSNEYGFVTLHKAACRITQAQTFEWFGVHHAVKLFLYISKNEDQYDVKALKQKVMQVLEHYSDELGSDNLLLTLFPCKMSRDLFKKALQNYIKKCALKV